VQARPDYFQLSKTRGEMALSPFRGHGIPDWIAGAVAGTIAVALCSGGLPLWWMADDTQVLKQAAAHRFWEYFTVPSAWRELTPFNLTPWLTALYDLDLFLFGLAPAGFYAHHLALCALLAVTIPMVLRLWLPPVWAGAAVLFFVLSPCYTENVYYLMTRHYGEGLLWSLWALFCSVKAQRTRRLQWAWAGAGFYAAASLCKEIYVPLVLLLPLLSAEDGGAAASLRPAEIRKRLPFFTPFLVTAVTYLLYRRWMLGHWVGGYPAQDHFGVSWTHVNHLLLADHWWIGAGAATLALLGIVGPVARRGERAFLAVLTVLAAAAPLYPVLPALSRRHLFLPTFLLAAAAAAGLSFLSSSGKSGRGAALALVLILALGFFQANLDTRRELDPVTDGYEVQGRFLWDVATPSDVLFVDSIPAWYFHGLQWLGANHEQGKMEGQPVIDLCSLAATRGSIPAWRRYWSYDRQSARIVKADTRAIQAKLEACSRQLRADVALDVRIWREQGSTFWSLGPFEEGDYSLVDSETGSSVPLPKTGRIAAVMFEDAWAADRMRVCYAHPAGWKACAPFRLDLPGAAGAVSPGERRL